MKKVLEDPRIQRMMQKEQQEPIASMKQMYYGGFEILVSA
jgi:uncharacterized protein YbaA (DUF1428 family)